jgi:hypothetical protein
MKKWSFVALLLVGATVLGATVLREPVAWAAQTMDAKIIGPLDGNGNVRVAQQGTVAATSADANTILFHSVIPEGESAPDIDSGNAKQIRIFVRALHSGSFLAVQVVGKDATGSFIGRIAVAENLGDNGSFVFDLPSPKFQVIAVGGGLQDWELTVIGRAN